jgi:ectoine hydroxylase-related dioxygenase (phytanoyl-CoA dioxygenase family)
VTAHAIAAAIRTIGFAVIERPLVDLRAAYDREVASADARDLSRKECTRVHDFVNRTPKLDLWRDEQLLAICDATFAEPYKLSTFHARAVNPGGGPQQLHVDCERIGEGVCLLGFVWMIDEFREDNGATRFALSDREVVACGRMGSLLVYDGSIRHGYSANRSSGPRRSLQGAFVLRTMKQGFDQRALLRAETRARLDARALYVLDAA